ncbi:MAG: DsbA family protein [Bosea sp. (in: a-proteobacteria)]
MIRNAFLTRRALVAAMGATSMSTMLARPALAQTPSVADLAVAGPLGDMPIGAADAKVTLIEYASLTCGHCARFHKDTWPALKAKYVDTGKMRYILREFPLDPLATAGFMVARCAPEGKYHPVVDLLFQQQQNWAFVDKPLASLINTLRQAGFTQETVEACLKRDEIYAGVNEVKNRGAEKLGVSSTPTFFINGQKHSGALSLQEFEKIIDPLLKS